MTETTIITPEQAQQWAERFRTLIADLTTEVSGVIVGMEDVVKSTLIALVSGGHVLLEGMPGLGKTLLVRTLSDALDLGFSRIQFTPDLMPSDITGTEIIQEEPGTRRRCMVFQKGPIFAQLVLADEINRTPPKTQAALLEAMQEHSVTVGNRTHPLDEPFFVLATQNPIEQEGTYPLPEAQRDRFMFHVRVTYPERDQEREIIRRTTGRLEAEIRPVITGAEILAGQRIVRAVPVPDHVTDFILDLVRGCRPGGPESLSAVAEFIEWGPGPRACQMLTMGGKVRALLRGRHHVTADDIEALAYPVLRHRLVPTFKAEAEGITPDEIIRRALEAVPRGAAAPLI